MSKRSIALNKKGTGFAFCATLLLAFSIASTVVPYRTYILVFLLFIGALFVGKSKVRKDSAVIPLFFMYSANCVSNFMAGNDIFSSAATLLEVVFIYFCVHGYCSDRDDFDNLAKLIFWPIFIGGPVIGSIQMILGRFVFPAVGDERFVRTIMVNANQTNSNYSALTMLSSFFLALYLCGLEKKKYLYAGFAIWSAVAVLLTLSRGAMISAGVGFLMAMLLRPRTKKKRITSRDVLTFFVLAMVILASIPTILESVMGYLGSKDLQLLFHFKESSTISGRTAQWNASVQAFLDGGFTQKLFGNGSKYALVLGRYSSYYRTAHNIFFGQLAENGIIGFVCSIWLYIGLIEKEIRLYKREKRISWIACWPLGIFAAYLLLSIIGWEFWLAVLVFDAYYETTEQYGRELL